MPLRLCLQDSLAFKAFGKEPILTMGTEHFDADWELLWRERLSEHGKLQGIGWTTTVTMEAHVVNLRDAAAEGAKGLLHPLLKRYQVRGRGRHSILEGSTWQQWRQLAQHLLHHNRLLN